MQITSNTLGAQNMQHVMCHMVQRDSSASKSDRVEIAFISVLFHGLKLLTDESGEETGVPREKPDDKLPENATF